MSKKVDINEIHYKRCSHCNNILPLKSFHKSNSSPDGLHYVCIECVQKLNKKSRAIKQLERPYHTMWRRIIDICNKAGQWNKGTRLTQQWELYGGRGIKVSQEFLDYDTFEQHMIELKNQALELYGPNVDLWIDRIDVNGHYERGNLRFISTFESAMNKRECQVEEYEHLGLALPITWWCRIYEIERGTVLNRMRKGWGIARALNEPVEVKFSKNHIKEVVEIEDEIQVIDGVYLLNGDIITFTNLCRTYNQNPSTIKARQKRGMSLKEALSLVN